MTTPNPEGSENPPDGFQPGLDPSLLDGPWTLPQHQYGTNFNTHAQPYQHYAAHAPQYSTYGLSQGTAYSTPAYSGTYGAPYYQTNQVNAYDPSYYGQQSHPGLSGPQSNYLGDNNGYGFQDFSSQSATISPHALQRSDVAMPPVQDGFHSTALPQDFNQNPSFSNGWSHTAPPQPPQHSTVNPAGLTRQPEFARNDTGPVVEPSRGSTVQTPPSRPNNLTQNHVAISTTASTVRGAKSDNSNSTLRITHPDLLKDETLPAGTQKLAPYLFREARPKDLATIQKVKVPKFKPLLDRTGKPLVPGVDLGKLPSASSSTTTQNRVRSSKLASTAGKAKSTLDQLTIKDARARIIAGAKPVDSPSASETASSSEEDDESSQGESSEEEEDDMAIEQITDVRSETKPTDPEAAAAWEAVGIVWVPRHRYASREEILERTPQFEKFIVNLRDDLKAASAELTVAESEKRPTDIKRLQEARSKQARLISRALQSVVKYGHRDILEYFGKSGKLVNSLVGILIDCVKAKEFDGDLPKATLMLISKLNFLTDGLLQKTKFDLVEKRLNNNSTPEIKGYISTIRGNTPEGKERAKKAEEDALKAEKEKALQVKARKAEEIAKPTTGPSGIKRPMDPDSSTGSPNKKIASEATAVGQGQKAVAAKPRTTGVFASVKRPAPKPPAPVTRPDLSKTQTKIDPKVDSRPVPTSTPQSSLASILASIEKPKEVPKPVVEPSRPPETPEEKARRERKESRRHLRVRWKEDTEMTEVRLFRHELAEDEGRPENLLRDARDDRSEGMMLKQRLVDAPEDDEDESFGQTDVVAYPENMILVDFGGLDPAIRAKSYVTRGGEIPIDSSQKLVQDKREAMELMVIYTDPSDIPPSPREAPFTSHDNGENAKTFGKPNQTWLIQRLEELRLYGYDSASALFVRRLDEQRVREGHGAFAQAHAQAATEQSTNVHSMLTAMQGLSHQQQQNAAQSANPVTSTNTPKMDPTVLAGLEQLFAAHAGKPFPPKEPPDWMSEKGKAEWWEGYNRDEAEAESKRAAQLPAIPAQPHIATPQPHYPQGPTHVATQPARQQYDPSQLENVLAGLAGQNNNHYGAPQSQPQLQPQHNGQYDAEALQQQQAAWMAAWQAANAGNGTKQAYGQQPGWGNGWPAPATDNQRSSYDNPNQMPVGGRSRDGDKAPERERRIIPTKASEYKGPKKPCKFWQEGKCAKGANCTFLHEYQD